jgi:arylsulfatase A-like enzyme
VAAPMNLIVYLSDALRTDHVGCYGARFVRTPTIDALAASGVRFDQAIATAPWTCPSTTSMITGLYPHHHGHFHWDSKIDEAMPNLFTVAKDAGLTPGSFVFDRDFLFKGIPGASVEGTSETLDGAIEWLRAHRSEPFVLWFHSWATHMPYDILHSRRKEWRQAKADILAGIQSDSASALEELKEGYRRAVEYSSETLLASFLEELESLGLRDKTALAFIADHGESWGERFDDKKDVKGTYHMHGARLDEEVVQVPFILSAPGLVEPTEIYTQVSMVDLTPTLLDLIGMPLEGVDGSSLMPLVRGEEKSGRPAFICGTDGGRLSQLALRLPPWKLLLDVDTGEERAYNLDVDPRERTSVPDEAPFELRERLYAELESAEQHELSAEEEATVASRLADLGYL